MKTPLHRRIIYLAFIIIFLIASPLVILFTMGYRYNMEKGRVQKTGIIKITSQPRGATIFLNNSQYQKTLTPAKIEYQLPGDYEIKLTKDGYFDWQKKLPVFENGTTFAEKVILWKKSDPTSLYEKNALSSIASPNGNSIIFLNQEKNIIALDINSGFWGDLASGKAELITNLAIYDTISLLEFSPSNRYILAQTTKKDLLNYLIIDTLNKTSFPLTNKKYKEVRWNIDSDELYALDASGLWRLDFVSNKADFIKLMSADSFYLNGKTIYYLSQQTIIQDSLTGSNGKELSKVDCQACIINTIKSDKALITRANNKTMLIVDLNNKIKNVQITADRLSWLDHDSVLLYNNFEIYIFDLFKTEPELITRLGTPINSAIWHPQSRHLVFSTEHEIKIIELDNRELRNIITIANMPATFMRSDRAGKNLYFSSGDRFYKLNLQ